MNVDTMRRIDRLAGVPLCAIATLLVRLRDWLRPARRGRCGACCSSNCRKWARRCWREPAMRKARDALSAELFFVIFARNVGSLELLGTFPPANVFTISRHLAVCSWRATRSRSCAGRRRKEIDTVVDLELFSRFTALLTGLSGADRRVGFHRFHNEGLYRGEMLTHRVAYNPHIHIAKNFIALVDALLAATADGALLQDGDRRRSDQGRDRAAERPSPRARCSRAFARRRRSIRRASAWC